MKVLAQVCSVVAIAASSSAALAKGGYVGNGGDAVQCAKAATNRFEGYYALDYLATLPTLAGDDGLRKVATWAESRARLTSLLRAKSPALAASFESFAALVYNASHQKDRVWEASPFGLVPLDDQRLTSLIPDNCKTAGQPKVIQAIIRLYEPFAGTAPGHFVYKFDPLLLQDLDRQAPLQLSFLLVHEWLWDLSANIDRNRRVNRFLHSSDAETLSPAAFEAELKGMGLAIPSHQADEFEDQSCQGYPLDEKPLHDFYPGVNVIANWGRLKILRRERDVTCSSSEPDCDLSWRSPRIPTPQLQIPFYLSATWFRPSDPKPIGILGPTLKNPIGPLVPGAADLKCGFVPTTDHNLECTIEDPTLVRPLLADLSARAPTSPPLVLSATLTEECFRFKITGSYKRYVSTAHGPEEIVPVQTETVFFLRAAKGVFLAPRP